MLGARVCDRFSASRSVVRGSISRSCCRRCSAGPSAGRSTTGSRHFGLGAGGAAPRRRRCVRDGATAADRARRQAERDGDAERRRAPRDAEGATLARHSGRPSDHRHNAMSCARRRQTHNHALSLQEERRRHTCAGARMADDTILETRGLTKEFKGFVAVKDVEPDGPPRHDPRADRPERRRQDHLLQPAHAFPDADARPDFLQRARDHRVAARRRSRGWGSSARSRSPRCFPHLTVLENVRIALQRKRGHSFDFWRVEATLAAASTTARAS